MTTEVELCKQMSSDDWRWNCSWNHCESRGDPGASRMMFIVYDIGHVWSLKIMKDENSYTHQTLGFVWEVIKVMIISNFWFKVNQIQHYTKVFFLGW